MFIQGDPSNWKETLHQFVLLNDLSTHDAPMYEEFIEALVNSLTEAWAQIITAKVIESQDVAISLELLVKLGSLVKGLMAHQVVFNPTIANFGELVALSKDPKIVAFLENPASQVYLPKKV